MNIGWDFDKAVRKARIERQKASFEDVFYKMFESFVEYENNQKETDFKKQKRKNKIEALLNNPAATEGEKQAAREALKCINV